MSKLDPDTPRMMVKTCLIDQGSIFRPQQDVLVPEISKNGPNPPMGVPPVLAPVWLNFWISQEPGGLFEV